MVEITAQSWIVAAGFTEKTVSSPSLTLVEDAVVNVCHEVSSGRVGHHKAHVVCSLETAVQVHQEWMTRRVDHFKDPLFTHEAEHDHTDTVTY